jgi:hypothetical protein
MRSGVRKFANVQGTTALLRHPDADINDYINRALGSLHRKLTTSLPDQRILATTTITTEDGVRSYALTSDFDHLISAEVTFDGHRYWMQGFEMPERAELISSDNQTDGKPWTYRLRGSEIEFLPTPGDEYDVQLWYVPAASQLTASGQAYDTISRLDEYVIAYAARPIAIKDKNWDLVGACKQIIDELSADIEVLARNRDRNSPPRIVDTFRPDRWGRSRRYR